MIAGALGASACGLDNPKGCDIAPTKGQVEPAKAPAWLRDARIAGIEVYAGQTACELKPVLDQLADEHVSVVEVDPELSAYLSEKEFKVQADLLDLIARGCHRRGMRAVAYYPTLEVLTADADKTDHTMGKDHPDWVQTSITGAPNMFVGGGGRVFWVRPGEESAWLCPNTGYRDYFNARIATLARTRIDGLWGDVPLYSDIVGEWPCVGPACSAKFKKETGLEIPNDMVWDDPVVRRWIMWRHQQIWEFEQNVVASAKRIRPTFEVIIETVTMDYNAGTLQGLDGAAADDGDVYRVWEVDAVSDATAMRHASADDWMSMTAMMRHARGVSHPRASWIFSYGLEEDDAEHVMALAITTGNNPYESKIPIMNTSVGHAYRKKMFGWLTDNIDIYRSTSANSTAILFSSASRDFLDRNAGVGLYTSLNPNDELWWSTNDFDSAKRLAYLGDYRGWHKTLVHAHIPYDVVTSPHATLETLNRYELLVAPSMVAMSKELLSALQAFVSKGGRLIVTGNDVATYDEAGKQSKASRLLTAFGLKDSPWTRHTYGAGEIFFSSWRLGKVYFNDDDPSVLARVEEALGDGGRQIQTNAPKAVVMDLRRTQEGAMQLLCANLDGLGEGGVGEYTPRDASFDVSLATRGDDLSVGVQSRPGEADRALAVTTTTKGTTFSLSLHTLAMVTLRAAS